MIFSSLVRSRVSRGWVERGLRDGWEWDSWGEGAGLGNQYHSPRPGTPESLLQLAVWGLLAPVLAKLLSFCLPALKWCGKMLLESSLPASWWREAVSGHAQTQAASYGSLAWYG